MKKNFFKFLLPVIMLAILVPIFAFAQNRGLPPGGTVVCNPAINDILDFICKMGLILKALIPFLFGLGMLYFVWGVVTYVIADDEEAKSTGRNRIVFGIIGFSVLVGVWSLVSFVLTTFNLTVSNSFTLINPGTVLVPAQSGSSTSCTFANNPKLQDLFTYIGCIITNSVIPLIFAFAIASFVWGVVQYVINDSDEGKKERGRDFMVWGVIALSVMISVWGLVKIVGNTFNINTGFIPQVKQGP